MKTIVIAASCASYRIPDFVAAAELLRLHPILASDGASPTAADLVNVDLTAPEAAGATIAAEVPDAAAVVAADDSGVMAAAHAAELLGLARNPRSAAAATRDKLAMRQALAAAGVAQPDFRWGSAAAAAALAAELGFPVVLKPRRLSASRGVIRADDHAAAVAAAAHVAAIAGEAGEDAGDGLLIEEYVPGSEIAIEGLLADGELVVLANIDKPVPLTGPYFAESIFVTPSRHDPAVLAAAGKLAAAGCRALGLVTGPVHAEVRIDPAGTPRLIEIAARTIGGLCGRSLAFGLIGETLETIVLRAAVGETSPDITPARPASGVLMIPVEDGGVLDGIEGLDDVRALPGITGVEITATPGKRVDALPEADRYLGFVFAAGENPAAVEAVLREAAATLTVVVDGEAVGPLLPA